MQANSRDLDLIDDIRHLITSLYDENHDWGCDKCREDHERLLSYMRELYFLRRQLHIGCEDGDSDDADKLLETIKQFYNRVGDNK